MAGYSLEIKRSAARELERLEPRSERRRIVDRIRALAGDPRPAGAQKLAGRSSLFRVRQGDHRILYEVHDSDRRIVVLRIGHRREVYR
ncbi:MAG: RelE/StbE family addiction module toxin [Acidobacteria bacterium]|nr:RelE/StbE family addiction module toxin [Acidobacteriota bacterium]